VPVIPQSAAPRPKAPMPNLSGDVASQLVASAPAGFETAPAAPGSDQAARPIPAQAGPASVAGPREDQQDPYVQLASLVSRPDALLEWKRLTRRLPGLLEGREPTITSADSRGWTYWRLRTFGFSDAAEARELCGRLKAEGFGCWSGRGL